MASAKPGYGFGRSALALPCLALAACATSPEIAPGPVASAPDTAMGQSAYTAQPAGAYVLRPSDVVSVSVFREPDLSLERAVIDADGAISLPLIGLVQLGGRTPGEAEYAIERALGDSYLRNADVAVNIVDYASHRVSVEGAVSEPGIYQFQPGTRLSGAIALAQGLERTAQSRDVAVFRQGADGLEIAKFDYASISRGTMMDPLLMPGDRVVIGINRLEQTWQDVLRALPAFGLFSRF